MGRISYTPSTISWLASQAGQSDDGASKAAQDRAGTPERCACSSTSCIDTDKCAEGLLAVPDARRHNKSDAPYIWSQHQFDPDDQSLPAVDETFLDGPASGASLMQLLSFSSVEGDDAEEDEDEEGHDDGSDSDEDHVEEGVADYTEEVTEEIIEDANDRFWALASPHTEAITPEAAQQGGFSPSVGVFHSHTLPFFLPAVGSMQRRASNEHAVTPSTGPIAVSSEA